MAVGQLIESNKAGRLDLHEEEKWLHKPDVDLLDALQSVLHFCTNTSTNQEMHGKPLLQFSDPLFHD